MGTCILGTLMHQVEAWATRTMGMATAWERTLMVSRIRMDLRRARYTDQSQETTVIGTTEAPLATRRTMLVMEELIPWVVTRLQALTLLIRLPTFRRPPRDLQATVERSRRRDEAEVEAGVEV